MKVKSIGEFGLIDRINRIVGSQPLAVEGIGDDAAVLQYSWDKYLLATTDTLVQGVHFPQGKVDYHFLGQKTLIANISDIAAMGGTPTAALISLALPAGLEVKKVEAFYRGLREVAEKNHIAIVGGDTVAGPKAVVITLCLLGEVKKRNLMLRRGAKVGDLICVTGKFGVSAKHKYLVVPPIRLKEAQQLAQSGAVNAMIDSSDGLAVSVRLIARASEVGAELWEKEIPKAGNINQALFGGEDYELVFTVPQSKINALKNHFPFVTVVGRIVPQEKEFTILDAKNRRKLVKNLEFRHF